MPKLLFRDDRILALPENECQLKSSMALMRLRHDAGPIDWDPIQQGARCIIQVFDQVLEGQCLQGPGGRLGWQHVPPDGQFCAGKPASPLVGH